MSARPLFVGGTSSNAGKSWMVTAICAWLRQRGVRVAPFKAQNMSNHSYPCRAGGEIGRAQVAQAEACGLEPEPSMNPILLKPTGNGSSQVVVNGRVWKTMTAREYYEQVDGLRTTVLDAFRELSSRFDAVIIEGAGSVSELNLRQVDLVNLGLVTRIGSPWLLVADIERGGVFASVLGTVDLLSDEERSLFRGFAINKFRGDPSLFEDGVALLEQRTAAPCLGVFPYQSDLHLDAEDSLAVPVQRRATPPVGARIAIVRFPHLSNATDFRLLDWADWISSPTAEHYDAVILPGTKSTIADLQWLRAQRLDEWVLAHHRTGATVLGVCGGYQMLGRVIRDPDGVESSHVAADGLGLLPVDTMLLKEKRTRVVQGLTDSGGSFGAYEIHMGATTAYRTVTPFARLQDGTLDGARHGAVIGTYLHGALEHAGVCAEVFGVPMAPAPEKRSEYARLAEWFERHSRHREQLGFE